MDEKTLKQDVREQTGNTSTQVLSNNALDTAYRNAKRHIRSNKSLDVGIDWFEEDKPAKTDALFWYTCLFVKIALGELDSQAFQSGAIDKDALLAKADDDVTMWFRNARSALRNVKGGRLIISGTPTRENRTYTSSYTPRSSNGGGGDSGGSGGLSTDGV